MRPCRFLICLLALAAPVALAASPISVGQFSIEYPSAETVGYYGFAIANLTGNTTAGACSAGYPVCNTIEFQNATLTVQYGYGQVADNGSGAGVVTGPLVSQGTYTATAQDANAFDASYNGCGVYGVDSGCAGLDDTANAFQLPLPVLDGSGNTLVILSATFSATSAATATNAGSLAGPYTATLLPVSDCAGPCNFLDPGLHPGDPYVGDWEYYDATVDITTPAPTSPATVPEPATAWLLLSGLLLAAAWRRAARLGDNE